MSKSDPIKKAVDKVSEKNPQPVPLSDKQIWNRVGHVEIIVWEGEKAQRYNFEGLDFKFSVSQILGRMPEGNMSVSICGLSQDTANKLVTLCSVKEALVKRKTLKLYAGYADPEDRNYKGELIATMDIINATITSPPPDIWLQITAVYAGWLNDMKFVVDVLNLRTQKTMATNLTTQNPILGTNYAMTKADYVPLKMCLEQICKGLNGLQSKRKSKVKYDYSMRAVATPLGSKEPYNIPGATRHFYFYGTLAELPTKISESYRVNAIWEPRGDDEIDLTIYPDPKFHKVLSYKEKNAFTQGTNIKFLDVTHGLIGIPKLKDSIKLECRCFLDGKIKAGDFVSVRSELLPAIYEGGERIMPANFRLAQDWSGEKGRATIKAYQIMRIKYTGHLRGNDWYCDIEARRPSSVINMVKEDEEVKGPRKVRLTEDWVKKIADWEIDEKTGGMTHK